MVTDCIGQELIPGDYVIVHGYSSLSVGVFVRFNGRNYHVQEHYFYNGLHGIPEQLERYRQKEIDSISTGKVDLPQVVWKQDNRKLFKINPSALPENVVELLRITKDLLYQKRKIRIV